MGLCAAAHGVYTDSQVTDIVNHPSVLSFLTFLKNAITWLKWNSFACFLLQTCLINISISVFRYKAQLL